MASPGKRGGDRRGIKAVRPGLLAGGLGLMWFVQMQAGAVEADAPGWAAALMIGGRLLADVVGAWIVVSVVRLGIALARLAATQWRAYRGTVAR